jgi:hypothetical protein
MTMTRSLLLVPLAMLGLLLDAGCSRWGFITTKKVVVGPGACDLTPSTDVPLSKGAGDQAAWKPSVQGTPLTIVFKRTGFPSTISKPPFANMPQNANGDYYIPSSLQSGPINTQLTDTEIGDGLTYKYDQILAGIPCDGRIIIQR